MFAVPTVATAQASHPTIFSTCLRYEPDTARVTGKLTRRIFYGPPGFGEDPKNDARETGFYLELLSPLCMYGSDDINVAKTDVRLIQILLDQHGYERLRPSIDRVIILRGTLSGAITGHHHAPILLEPVRPLHVEHPRPPSHTR
jgi:hypothetical protein